MGKKPGRKGWADRLLDPLKQRLTLTEPGQKQAPLRKRKSAKKAVKKAALAPLSARDRQVKELKTM
ncbi:MAG: hypothetical protein HOE48_09495, partial [Candidatus Latescibacteria bacterium]|nr:hypothetical protein [Candidatus Latescibacterota bacterium]